MDDTVPIPGVLAPISWTGLNEITESDALGKGYTSYPAGHCLRMFYTLSFIFISTVRAKGSTAGRIAAEYNAYRPVPGASSCGRLVGKKCTRSLASFISSYYSLLYVYVCLKCFFFFFYKRLMYLTFPEHVP